MRQRGGPGQWGGLGGSVCVCACPRVGDKGGHTDPGAAPDRRAATADTCSVLLLAGAAGADLAPAGVPGSAAPYKRQQKRAVAVTSAKEHGALGDATFGQRRDKLMLQRSRNGVCLLSISMFGIKQNPADRSPVSKGLWQE